jgi:hypothetical protein
MKQIVYAGKSLLVGDAVADKLFTYAILVANRGVADGVILNAVTSDGEHIEASLVLGSGASVMITTSSTVLPEPDNTDTITYLDEQISRLESPALAAVAEAWTKSEFSDALDNTY